MFSLKFVSVYFNNIEIRVWISNKVKYWVYVCLICCSSLVVRNFKAYLLSRKNPFLELLHFLQKIISVEQLNIYIDMSSHCIFKPNALSVWSAVIQLQLSFPSHWYLSTKCKNRGKKSLLLLLQMCGGLSCLSAQLGTFKEVRATPMEQTSNIKPPTANKSFCRVGSLRCSGFAPFCYFSSWWMHFFPT